MTGGRDLRTSFVGRRSFVVILTAWAGLAAALTMLPVTRIVRYGAAVALLWLVPALAWASALPGDLGQRLVGGLGLGFVGSGLATLALHLVPGPFPTGIARLVYLALPFPALFLGRWRLRLQLPVLQLPALSRPLWMALVFLLLIASLTRVVNLGYSEFQGDEAVIMARAAQALAGDDRELFLHQKGPVEILVPMALWSLTGTISEWQARLPFALAGMLAVGVVGLLAARWFDRWAGVVAGLLAAIAGFLVAFSRIVQYQNFVVAMGGLGLLWLLSYRASHRRLDLILSAIYVAYGLLAHYDAVLVGPAALWILVMAPAKGRGMPSNRETGGAGDPRGGGLSGFFDVVTATGAGIVILALFYLPFVLDPMFSRTFAYLSGGRMGGGLLHNSLVSVWRMSVFYNLVFYVVGLGLAVLIAAGIRLGPPSVWLYALVPLFFYAFMVVDPRTHVYTFYPGVSVLAGAAIVRGWRRLWAKRRRLAVPLAGVVILWYGFAVGYVNFAFVQHRVEYKRKWPQSRHSLYPVPFSDDALPPYGHFGFPYRAGWKAVNALFATGTLDGTYAGNEEPEITTWYVRDGVRTMCGHPDLYVVAQNVQDEIPIDDEALAQAYTPVAQVLVKGVPKITVYERGAVSQEMMVLDAADYAPLYDAGTTVEAHLPSTDFGRQTVGADFGDVGRLLGYDLARRTVSPGGSVTVTLYWEALSSPARNYQVFTHLVHGDELVAQDDGAPACDHAPTSLWEEGEIIRDEHVIDIDAAASLGDLSLYVGLYDLLTLDRLPVDGGLQDRLYLTTVEVIR